MKRKNRASLRLLIPILLITVGVAALSGCFRIPATGKLQPDGKRRPETLVGTGKDAKIILGQTTIEDALILLSKQTSGPRYNSYFLGSISKYDGSALETRWQFWELDDLSERRVSLTYQTRTSTEVWPLCFSAIPIVKDHVIRVEFDKQGVVTGVQTDPPRTFRATTAEVRSIDRYNSPAQILIGFSPESRRKLHAAGLIPSDADLQKMVADMAEFRAKLRAKRDERKAATLPSATQPAAR